MSNDLAARLATLRNRFDSRLEGDRALLMVLLQKLHEPNQTETVNDIERLAHGLAGSAGSFGYARINDGAAELERLIADHREHGDENMTPVALSAQALLDLLTRPYR